MKNFFNKFKEEYRLFIKDIKKRKLKRSLVSLFFAIMCIFTITNTVAFIMSIIMALFFSILGIKKREKLANLSLIISIVCIIISVYNYYHQDPYAKDPYEGKNVLVGIWEYNDSGGTYEFNKDFTYIQYISDNKKDNYCKGTYKYEYGYETNDGKLIRQDIDYTYYYLVLKHKECVINETISEDDSFDKKMVFGYGKVDPKKSVIVNTRTDNYHIMLKK